MSDEERKEPRVFTTNIHRVYIKLGDEEWELIERLVKAIEKMASPTQQAEEFFGFLDDEDEE